MPLEFAQIDVPSATLRYLTKDEPLGFVPGVDFIPVAGYRRSGPQQERITKTVSGGRLGARASPPPDSFPIPHAVVLMPPLGADGVPDYRFWDPPERLARYRLANSIVVGSLDLMPRDARARLAGPRYSIAPAEPGLDTFPAVFAATSSVAQLLMRFADSTYFDASYRVTHGRPDVRSHNVVAMLPGSDLRLRSEVIVLSAHADHMGIAERVDRVDGDSVINGANVGGSGAVALLEIGEYLASLPERPRRTVILLWVVGAAHESLGAKWFFMRPPVVPTRIVAHVNVDMLGRAYAADGAPVVSVVGSRDVSRDFAAWVREVGARPQFGVRADYALDDGPLSAQLRCSGMHPHFARRGIPSAFVTAGPSDDYHRVTDEVKRIDFAQFERTTTFVAGLVLDLANNPSAPKADSAQAFASLRCPWNP